MKPLLAACALAALVIALVAVRSDDQGNPPELPALTSAVPARDDQPAQPLDTLITEATPVAARVAAITENAAFAGTSATGGAAAPPRTTATLTVRVVDEDGVGVHRANVVLQPTPEEVPALRTGRGNGHTFVQGNTDREGRVTLEVSAGRPLELRAGAFGETSEGSVLVDSLAAGERAEATIVVKARADIELQGRVVDAESGAPLQGIELRIEQRSGDRTSSRDAALRFLPPASPPHVVTDVAGRFCVPAKSWATATALLTGAGWSPHIARLHRAAEAGPPGASARVDSTEPKVVEIALRRAARIEGTVLGAPGQVQVRVTLAGHALVTADHLPAWTFDLYGTDYLLTANVDTTGVFTIEDIPAGASLALSLVATQTGALLLQEAQTVQIAPGATHRVTWTLGTGGRFDCSVHYAAGAPAPNEELWLLAFGPARPGETEADWEPLQRAHTDASGRAVFQDVQPGRWVVALAPTTGRRSDSSLRYAVSATIDAPGTSVPVAFTLRAGLYISGTIVAPDGAPSKAFVSASSGTFGAYVQESSVKNGRFRVGPLLPGRYSLAARLIGQAREGATPLSDSDVVSAEAGADDVVLQLKAGCAFVLAAIDSVTGDPLPAAYSVIAAERESQMSIGGYLASATIGGQAPGRYRVVARSETGLVGVVAVEVEAGERRAVTVPLGAGGGVRVAYSGPARVLTVALEEESGAQVALVYVPTGNSEALRAPVGNYTLRLAVREFDHTTLSMKTLREETRAVTIAADAEVAIEIAH